jgi:hypothetical protein
MSYFDKKDFNITNKCYFTCGYQWVRTRCVTMDVELHKYLKTIVSLATVTHLQQNWKQGGILSFSLFLIVRGVLVFVVPIIQMWWIAVSQLGSEFYKGMLCLYHKWLFP